EDLHHEAGAVEQFQDSKHGASLGLVHGPGIVPGSKGIDAADGAGRKKGGTLAQSAQHHPERRPGGVTMRGRFEPSR
ncbi:hypothetical protein RF186_13115, partial [Escherichia coli]|uniref:hypothetical protein n=1 Tax=Escherichia coli TaxID=562 RepID=UPI002813D1BC